MQRTTRCGWSVLLGLAYCGAPTFTAHALEDLEGLPLEQALEALQAEGLALVYSSDLVQPWMRVAESPSSSDPSQALTEILAPFELAARPGPAGSVLIVRATATADDPAADELADLRTQAELVPPPMPSIEEIVVAASQFQLARSVGESVTLLSSEDIEYMPDLGDDVLRRMTRLPGVVSDSVSARTNVRGGETRETVVLFDGLRLHDPFHLKDFNSVFSAVDSRVVSSMDVYTGGFPATFGESLSGVVDVTSLETPEQQYNEVTFSFFNTSVLSSGYIGDGVDDGAWVASIRRGNLDLLHETSEKHVGRPTYEDAYAKVAFPVSDTLRLTANLLYIGDDIFVAEDDGDHQGRVRGQDHYFWLRLDHDPNPVWQGTTLIARTELINNRSGYTRLPGISTGWLDDRRTTTLYTAQSDWTAAINERVLVRFGGSFNHMKGRYLYSDEVAFDVLVDYPGAPGTPERTRDYQLNPAGNQSALYGSVRVLPSERIAMQFGLRWDRQTLSPRGEDMLAPRFGVRYRLADRLYLKGSLGRFYQAQAIHEVQLQDGVQRYFPPQRADHAVIGLERDFRSGLRLRLEAYYKGMNDLRPRYENLLNSLVLVPELKPDRIRIAPEEADARGLEVFLDHRLGSALTWWAGYSWSRVTDRIDGRRQPRSWDRTHALSAGISWDTDRWNIGSAVALHTGWPTTPVALGASGAIVALGERNSDRVGYYRAVDLRITRKFQRPRSSGSVFLELTNVFDRSNPFSQEYELVRGASSDALRLDTLHTLPRVPSLGVIWSF